MHRPSALTSFIIAINLHAAASEKPGPLSPYTHPEPSIPLPDPEAKRRHGRRPSAVAVATSSVLTQQLPSGFPVQHAMDEEDKKLQAEPSSASAGPHRNSKSLCCYSAFYGIEMRPGEEITITRTQNCCSSGASWNWSDNIYQRKWFTHLCSRPQRQQPTAQDRSYADVSKVFLHNGTRRAIRVTEHNHLSLCEATSAESPGTKGPITEIDLEGYCAGELFCATNEELSRILTYDRDMHEIVLYRIFRDREGEIRTLRQLVRHDDPTNDVIPFCFGSDGVSLWAFGLRSGKIHRINPDKDRRTSSPALGDERADRARLSYSRLGLRIDLTTSEGHLHSISADNFDTLVMPSK